MSETYAEYQRRWRKEHPDLARRNLIRSEVRRIQRMGFYVEWRGEGPDPRD